MSQNVNPFESLPELCDELREGLGLPPASGPLQMDETLIVRPGDVLIIRFEQGTRIDEAAADFIKKSVMAKMPGLAGVAVIAAAELAVYRPGG